MIYIPHRVDPTLPTEKESLASKGNTTIDSYAYSRVYDAKYQNLFHKNSCCQTIDMQTI